MGCVIVVAASKRPLSLPVSALLGNEAAAGEIIDER